MTKKILLLVILCLVFDSCSTNKYVRIPSDKINEEIPVIGSGIFPFTNGKINVSKNDVILIPECCVLGELGYEVILQEILYYQKERELRFKGMIRDHDTGEVWQGINIFTATAINTDENGNEK